MFSQLTNRLFNAAPVAAATILPGITGGVTYYAVLTGIGIASLSVPEVMIASTIGTAITGGFWGVVSVGYDMLKPHISQGEENKEADKAQALHIQERNAADLALRIERREREAELHNPSEKFQALLQNAKLIEQHNSKQKSVIKPKSKQEILEDKKKIVENLKLQQHEKLERLEALVDSSKIKQQELSNATSLVDQKLIEKQTITEYSERLSRETKRLSVAKNLQERKVADLTLRIERREMEAELLKPSETFVQLLENTKLIEQKNYKQKSGYETRAEVGLEKSIAVEPEVAIFQEPVVYQAEAVVFAAPKNTKPKKSAPVVTAASFREPREKIQTDFYGYPKSKAKNKNIS